MTYRDLPKRQTFCVFVPLLFCGVFVFAPGTSMARGASRPNDLARGLEKGKYRKQCLRRCFAFTAAPRKHA